MGIFLISLGNGVECYLFCPKRADANFVLETAYEFGLFFFFFLLKKDMIMQFEVNVKYWRN